MIEQGSIPPFHSREDARQAYRPLRRWIRQHFNNEGEFALLLGISRSTLSLRFNGRRLFTQQEMHRAYWDAALGRPRMTKGEFILFFMSPLQFEKREGALS